MLFISWACQRGLAQVRLTPDGPAQEMVRVYPLLLLLLGLHYLLALDKIEVIMFFSCKGSVLLPRLAVPT